MTLTATTAPSAATGTVTFLDGSVTLGTGTLSGGVATYIVPSITGGAHSYTAVYGGSALYGASTSAAVSVTATSSTYISTTFNEFSAGHALNATAPATDAAGGTWSDPNGDWTYVAGGGITARTADLNYPTLINASNANYSATFTYSPSSALFLFRYVDINDYMYVESFSFGGVYLTVQCQRNGYTDGGSLDQHAVRASYGDDERVDRDGHGGRAVGLGDHPLEPAGQHPGWVLLPCRPASSSTAWW